jgi:hypothetical protein
MLIIISTVLIYYCVGSAFADSFTVTNSYEDEQILHYTELWNEYKITADSGKQIQYSFKVEGNGTLMVLFVKGHSVDHNSDYLLQYSKDSSTKSFSDSFNVESDDGTQFTLIVMSEEIRNVTYTTKINVVDTPRTDFICGALILSLLIGCGGAASFLIRSKRKQLERIESSSQISGLSDNNSQKDSYYQPGLSPHKCETCEGKLSWLQQYNKWYCTNCEKYK